MPEESFDPIDEVFSRANPNPDRKGCPGQEVLKELALRKRPVSDKNYDHLAECSPCYREFRELQSAAARRTRRWPAIAAALLLALGGGSAWWAFNRAAPGNPSEPLARVVPAIPDSTVLDLRPFSATRGADRPSPVAPLTIKPARQRVVIVLPRGSEPGAYELRVLNEALVEKVSAAATARLTSNGLTIETDLDASGMAPGKYTLALRHDGEDWRLYPVRLG